MKGNGLWGLVILNQPVDIWVSDCVPNNWKVLLERTQQRNGEMCLLQYTKHLLSISTCDKCQRNNLKLNIVRLELHPIKVHSPWFHLGIDFFGPISPPSYIKWLLHQMGGGYSFTFKRCTGIANALFKVCTYIDEKTDTSQLYYYYVIIL